MMVTRDEVMSVMKSMKPLDDWQIASDLGCDPEELEPVLNDLAEEKMITRHEGKWNITWMGLKQPRNRRE